MQRANLCTGALIAVVLAVLAIACSMPPPCIERSATCPAGAAARIRAALAADGAPWSDVTAQPPLWRSDRAGAAPVLALSAESGTFLDVVQLEREPDRVRVAVLHFGRKPDDAERARWSERVDRLCERVAAACPEIGEWELDDDGTAHNGFFVFLAACPLLGLGSIVVVVVVLARRKRARA